MSTHSEKIQEVGRDDNGGLEGTMGRNRGEARGERCGMNAYKQGEGKRTNNGAKKTENEQAQIYVNH